MDGRVPLSPRTNIAAGSGAQLQPKMELLATPQGKKGRWGPRSSGLSSHKFQHCENVDSSNNLSYTTTTAASTPDAKQLHFPPPVTPKSNVKKRLGWNPKQQLPNEQDSGNSAAMFWSSQALSSKRISSGNCSGELHLRSDLWVFFPECTHVHCQDLKHKQTTLCQILLPQLPQMSIQLHLWMGAVTICNQYME